MSEFLCMICNREFNRKAHLDKHINKKFPCIPKNEIINNNFSLYPIDTRIIPDLHHNINNNENIIGNMVIDMNIDDEHIKKIECEYCNQTFTRNSSLTRHQKERCEEKNKQDLKESQINELIQINKLLLKQNNENKKQNEEILKQNKELKNELEKVKKIAKAKVRHVKTNKSTSITNNTTNTNTNTNTNTTNTNSNNTVNIQINKYGTENYNEMDAKLFLEPMLKEIGKQIFLKQIQNVYINPDLPQNHNIVITDRNRQVCKIHDGERWTTTNIAIVNDLLSRIVEHSKTKYEEYSEKYAGNKKVKDKLNVTKKYIDRCDKEHLAGLELEDDEFDNKSEIKRCNNFYEMVYNDIVNLLHDYKDIIVK